MKKEYGGKETYKSTSAMKKHEKAESPRKERSEKMSEKKPATRKKK